MSRLWLLSLACSVACADVIGADFGGKTLARADDEAHGGEAGALGGGGDTGGTSASGGSSSEDGGAHAVGGASPHSGGASGGSSSGGATTTGGTANGGTASGGASTGGADTGGSATGGSGSGGTMSKVVINEVYAEGMLAYIELYNVGDSTADLTGYELAHGDGVPVEADRIALAGSVDAGAYFVTAESCLLLVCDYFPFDIDTGGDTLWLLDGSGNLVDSVDYPNTDGPSGLDESTSYSRLPNGSGSPSAGALTKGSANQAP